MIAPSRYHAAHLRLIVICHMIRAFSKQFNTNVSSGIYYRGRVSLNSRGNYKSDLINTGSPEDTIFCSYGLRAKSPGVQESDVCTKSLFEF